MFPILTALPNPNYNPWQRMLLKAWNVNSANAFVDTAGNPFGAIYDPSAIPLGTTTVLTDSGRAGINTATELTDPPVNTAAALGNENGLLYNGTTTLENAGRNTSVNDIFDNGGFSVCVIKPSSDGEADQGRIWNKAQTIFRVGSEAAGFCKLVISKTFSTSGATWQTTNAEIIINQPNIVAISYDCSSTSNSPTLYVNSLTPSAITNLTTPVGTASSDAASNLTIGNSEAKNRTFSGYLGKYLLMKSIPTNAQLTAVFNFLADMYSITLT